MQIPYDKLYELYLNADLERYKLKEENKKLKEELNCALFGDKRTKQYKELMGISKKELQPNDMIEFKNGTKAFMDDRHFWIIAQYYDNELHCKTDSEYDVQKVYRPEYKMIYDRGKVKIK